MSIRVAVARLRAMLLGRRAPVASVVLVAWVLATSIPSASAASQTLPGGGQGDTTGGVVEAEAPDSPRATMRQFLAAAENGEFARAARWLQLDRRAARRGPESAERLFRFIERRIVIELDSISPRSEGDVNDGEPLRDHVGRMFLGVGRVARPIELARVTTGGRARWLVTPATLASADSAWATLDRSWTRGRLPASLLEPGPFGAPRWKWIAGILGLPLVWAITLLLSYLLRAATLAIARRTRATWDEEAVRRMRGPLRLFVASLLAAALPVILELDAATLSMTFRVLRAVTIVALFWAILRLIAIAERHLTLKTWATAHTSAQTIVPLLGRSLRMALGLAALLVAISEFGYPVGTVLAGLGIGGLVVALAAQKTVENLFGSVSLAADQVFRVGDWVRVENVEGTVERIGLRSTHLRTLDRTLVKIPNGRLADMRVESFGERDRIRFFMTLQLDRATTATQLRRVLADVEVVVRAQPRTWPEGVAIRFAAIGPQSLDVTVNAWVDTTQAAEFEVIRGELLLGILDAVERAGARLAIPQQALRMEADGAGLVRQAPTVD